jgi:hypothetical protein
VTEYATISFFLLSTGRDALPFTAEVHLVDSLPCNILLGTYFLSLHGLDVIWAKNPEQ